MGFPGAGEVDRDLRLMGVEFPYGKMRKFWMMGMAAKECELA